MSLKMVPGLFSSSLTLSLKDLLAFTSYWNRLQSSPRRPCVHAYSGESSRIQSEPTSQDLLPSRVPKTPPWKPQTIWFSPTRAKHTETYIKWHFKNVYGARGKYCNIVASIGNHISFTVQQDNNMSLDQVIQPCCFSMKRCSFQHC